MMLRFPVQVCGAFPFPLLGRYVDGIGGPSYQSSEEGVVHLKIEAVKAVRT